MQVFILGGTGSIGAAVTRHLVADGHRVTGLTRSPHAAEQLTALGARAVSGDMRTPDGWTHHLAEADALVHLAATFDDQMSVADAAVVQAVIEAAQRRKTTLRVLYTGGCWLYGNTGNQIADESTTLRPIAAFDFMRRHCALLQRCAEPVGGSAASGACLSRQPNHRRTRKCWRICPFDHCRTDPCPG